MRQDRSRRVPVGVLHVQETTVTATNSRQLACGPSCVASVNRVLPRRRCVACAVRATSGVAAGTWPYQRREAGRLFCSSAGEPASPPPPVGAIRDPRRWRIHRAPAPFGRDRRGGRRSAPGRSAPSGAVGSAGISARPDLPTSGSETLAAVEVRASSVPWPG
ncbi:hypothetical protein A8926_1794 [Saccharopolyspora spinosa]|uniref:Uncharacterized protein n=1 Tax=Saccharopolyspora spinosa TaxID=60894 RepID=A0A2N3XU63_SACSN|nr:hypothetical protein A8926_1794 [Saccharopolyspora spinosa]